MKMPVSPSSETLSPLSAFCSFSSSLLPSPQFPLRSGLEKAFRWVKPVKRDRLQTQGRDVRNVRFLHRRVGGREGKEWRRKTRLPKTRHGRRAKLWRFEGGGSGSAAPTRLALRMFPSSAPGLSIIAYLNTTLFPQVPSSLSSSQPRPPPALFKAPPFQWITPTTHPPAPLYHLWTPPYCCSFLHFSSLLSSLLLTSNLSNPRLNPPWDIAPSLPHPSLSRIARRRRTHRPGSGLDSLCSQRPRDSPGAGSQPFLGGEGEGEEDAKGFRPLAAVWDGTFAPPTAATQPGGSSSPNSASLFNSVLD